MPEDPIVTPAVVETATESNPVKQLREHADQLKAENKAKDALIAEMQGKIREGELATLSETERLKKQLEEITPFKDRAVKVETAMQTMYEKALAALPEMHRDKAARLSSTGDWADKFGQLQEVMSILTPQSAGSVTVPAIAQQASTTTEKVKIDFNSPAHDYFANHAKVRTGNIAEASKTLV